MAFFYEGGPIKTLERDSDGKLPSCAWPGGYQLVYTTKSGLEVCPNCANDPEKSEEDPPVAWEIFYEGPTKPCEDCGEPIESAYGDPDEEEEEDAPSQVAGR